MIKVLIADDQALVRAGFRAILEVNNDIEVVGEAAHGAEAVKLAQKLDRTSSSSTCACPTWTG